MSRTRATLRSRTRYQKKYPVVRNLPKYQYVGTSNILIQTVQVVLVETNSATIGFDTPFPVTPAVTANIVSEVFLEGGPETVNPFNVNVYIVSASTTSVTIRTSSPITATLMITAIHLDGASECEPPTPPVVEPATLDDILTLNSFIIDANQDQLEAHGVPYMRTQGSSEAMVISGGGSVTLTAASFTGGPGWVSDGAAHAESTGINPLGLNTSLNASDFTVVCITDPDSLSIVSRLLLETGAVDPRLVVYGLLELGEPGFSGYKIDLRHPSSDPDDHRAQYTTAYPQVVRVEFDTDTGTYYTYLGGAEVASLTKAGSALQDFRSTAGNVVTFLGNGTSYHQTPVSFFAVWPTRLSENASLKTDIESYLSNTYTGFGGTI